MAARPIRPMVRAPSPQLRFHLCGQIALDDALNLQRRLAYEAGSRDDGLITVIACEHEPVISIGRAGSRGDINMTVEGLSQLNLEMQYVARGGGTILHGPGQLVLYVIAPISRLRWSIGQYARRLLQGLNDTLEHLLVRTECREPLAGLWGRSGLLAAVGLNVRHGVAMHGAVVHVAPELRHSRHIRYISGNLSSRTGSLLSERSSAGRMASVRASLVEKLPSAFDCDVSHVLNGHPLLLENATDRELLRAA